MRGGPAKAPRAGAYSAIAARSPPPRLLWLLPRVTAGSPEQRPIPRRPLIAARRTDLRIVKAGVNQIEGGAGNPRPHKERIDTSDESLKLCPRQTGRRTAEWPVLASQNERRRTAFTSLSALTPLSALSALTPLSALAALTPLAALAAFPSLTALAAFSLTALAAFAAAALAAAALAVATLGEGE